MQHETSQEVITQEQPLVFTFGDPEPVMSRDVMDYLGVFADWGGKYWMPPVSLEGLEKCTRANPYHGPILAFKRNMTSKWFVESDVLKWSDLHAAAYDFQTFGFACFQKIFNRLGGLLALRRLPAMYMRPGLEPDIWFQVRSAYDPASLSRLEPIEFKPGEVVCVANPSLRQTVYGEPDYLGGLQAALLGEDLILFRRKFYRNGQHMGYILVTHGRGISAKTAEVIQGQVEESEGPGNFRSLYINVPNADPNAKEPVKIIPVGDIGTKDDYEKVANINIRYSLAMHRMQPGIAGVIPENTAGFGDLEKILRVYVELEVEPMQRPFLALNDLLPLRAKIAFRAPAWDATATA